MAELELRDVSKTFGGKNRVVESVSMHVPDGSFAVLVGPSGCGKSTTLRMVAGLEQSDSGEILIAGRRVNSLSPQRRNVAFVFQNYALYPHMTVADNMRFGLRMRGVPTKQARERVSATSKILGIEPLLSRYPMQLSGGERQRVALGRAIVRDPALFLLDEPLSNLDAQLRTEMRVELTKIQRRLAATFVFVTHDQVEAMTLADVLAVMNAGVLQQVGPPEEVYAKPANVFVAGFIGSPRMNLIAGEVRRGAAGVSLSANGTSFQLPLAPPAGDGRYIVGIRPEHARLDEAGSLELRVDVVEALGSQKFVYGVLAGGVPFTAGVDPRLRPEEGDVLRLSVDAENVHLFAPEDGARVS